MSTLDKTKTEDEFISQSFPKDKQMTAEDLAPDGGWGWMVAAGMIVVNLTSVCQGSSFGLLYGDLFEENENGGTALAIINLLFMVAFCFSGLTCNELLKTYNIKHVGTFGALIYAIANTVTCFVPNVYYVAMSFLVQGLGVGMMLTICTISLNAYFFKLRMRVMGATQVIIGLGPIVYPLLIEKSLATYGFRATIALLGVMSFNAVISMYIMDPVDQHYIKPKRLKRKNEVRTNPEKNSKMVLIREKFDPIQRHDTDAAKSWQKNRSVQSLRAEGEHEMPLLIEALTTSHRSGVSSISGLDIETPGSWSRPGKGPKLDLLSNRLSITVATSLSSITGAAVFGPLSEMEVKTDDGQRRSILNILANFFEVSLLQDWVYLNMCVGSSTALMSDILFGNYLPLILTDKGYSKADSALTLTVIAIAELASKVLFTVFTVFFKFKSRHIYFGAVLLLFLSRVVFLYCDTLTSTIVVIAVSGFARGWYIVNQTLIIAEHSSIERFPAAWGLSTIIDGCVVMILYPIIGFVRDWTQSYVITQYVLLGGLLACLILWTVEYLVTARD